MLMNLPDTGKLFCFIIIEMEGHWSYFKKGKSCSEFYCTSITFGVVWRLICSEKTRVNGGRTVRAGFNISDRDEWLDQDSIHGI